MYNQSSNLQGQECPTGEGSEVAGFIAKTYELLNQPDNQKIIFWCANRVEFTIKDTIKFEQMILPKYFRHNRINSFIRQLNMYGFSKTKYSSMRSTFKHPYFQKESSELLHLIKRKIKNSEKEDSHQLEPQEPIEVQKLHQNMKESEDKIQTESNGAEEDCQKQDMAHCQTHKICKCGLPMIITPKASPQTFTAPEPEPEEQRFSFMDTQKIIHVSLTKVSCNYIGGFEQPILEDDDLSIEDNMEERGEAFTGNDWKLTRSSGLSNFALVGNPSFFFFPER